MIKELCSVTAFFLECCGEHQNSKHKIYCQKGTYPDVTKSGNTYIGCYAKDHIGVVAFIMTSKEFINSVKLSGFYTRVGNGGVGTFYEKIAEPGANYKIFAGIMESIPSSIDLINSIKAVDSREKNSLPISQISQEHQNTIGSFDYYQFSMSFYCSLCHFTV